MKYDIIIAGGGPAGMTAAIFAAKSKKKVALLEHTDRLGRKLSATGNGKCNITNMNMQKDFFNSDSGTEFYSVIQQFSPEKLRDFFLSNGLLTRERDGYVYPYSEQAFCVTDNLVKELERLNVDVFTSIHIKSVKKKTNFEIGTDQGNFTSTNFIIACGSKCASKTGSDGSGYDLCAALGHTIIPVIPALTQLCCREDFFKELSGVRIKSAIRVFLGKRLLIADRGEVQLADYGISGIPVFNVSRHVKRAMDDHKKIRISLDLLPEYDAESLLGILNSIFTHNPELPVLDALYGIMNKKMAGVIYRITLNKNQKKCSQVNSTDLERICRTLKDFNVTPTDTRGFENAQVCAGGVSLKEINESTMESRLIPGLFFAGEILDVDAQCGGYNLQWAFASGRCAGMNAALK